MRDQLATRVRQCRVSSRDSQKTQVLKLLIASDVCVAEFSQFLALEIVAREALNSFLIRARQRYKPRRLLAVALKTIACRRQLRALMGDEGEDAKCEERK